MTNEEPSSPRAEVQIVKNLVFQWAMLKLDFEKRVTGKHLTFNLLNRVGVFDGYEALACEELVRHMNETEAKIRTSLNRMDAMHQLTHETFDKYFQQA